MVYVMIYTILFFFVSGKAPVRVIKGWSSMTLTRKLAMTPWRPEVKLRYHFLAERHSVVRLDRKKITFQRRKSFHRGKGHPMLLQLNKYKNPHLVVQFACPARTSRTDGVGLSKAILKVKHTKREKS